MPPFRFQALKSLGFEEGSTVWEDRLSELADYRKKHGDCNVSRVCSENTQLATWVTKPRSQYRLQLKGKKSSTPPLRFQALKSLGFE
jgi:hypothetical protein